MKKLLIVLALTLALTTPVFAQVQTFDFEGMHYGEAILHLINTDPHLTQDNLRIVGAGANRRDLVAERVVVRQQLVNHFIPNYQPGNVVDTHLIQDGRPIEGYTFASIQSQQSEGLRIEEGLPTGGIMTEWLYAYQGMTSLEMAIFNRINEVRVENNLKPLAHDPLLSVGARYRTAYFSRVLPQSEGIGHTAGTVTTEFVHAIFNPLGHGSGALGPNSESGISAGISLEEIAIQRVNGWMGSTPHRNAILNQNTTRMGVGVGDVTHRNYFNTNIDLMTYVFTGIN